ncbi:DEAD/DEAH box helicase [Pseudooceanicola algae]|uniref:ATP-dependent RNA helicase DeaD n=1 Tax=Pseudooceanicola algae TaxID=1537215 RepID=A0A418SIV9_9RHOB|nr:DEAD/DEAH box helicase [Pseudooceanicola algae]QPM91950.1 ATP-dependent RNA helicase DeaD [Pseudooceanicola algae]
MIQTLTDALTERGYETLTPVQEAVTNPELQDADLLVSAQTGSGKTVGFGLAIGKTLLGEDDRLGPPGVPMALVIAPTRELAFQVMRELDWLYKKAGARVVSCVGGMDMRDERRALDRGAHIVVGTPGRLRDHIQRGSLDMSGLRAVVLDEADEMLDLGFREDLEFMLGEAPKDRRTLMFSATVPATIATLAKKYQRDAVRVTTITGKGQHADIAYQAVQVAQHDAENAIINVLRYHEAQNAIVFANTRATVNRLTARFANRGFAVVCLSGELSQAERSHALQAMRDGRARVCVATDVAARGIDLPNLELVIHAELPSNVEGLLHRSGRTGRAGRKGISALIVPPKSARKADRLLKTAKVTAEWIAAPGADDILRRDEERLLNDPTWSEEISEDDAAFAARLLADKSPETVAAAYLRLFRSRNSAPEDLSPPDARPARPERGERPERAERAPFGPSSWFALSVGRDDRAEARWLLPLLCRAGNLPKEAIGAIRVQQDETYVELANSSVDGFLATVGDGGTLEDGVTVRRADGPPEGARSPKPGKFQKPRDQDRGPDRGERPAPRPAPQQDAAEATQPAPAEETPRPASPRDRSEKPAGLREGHAPKHVARGADAKPKWKSDKPAAGKGGKPAFNKGGKPSSFSKGGKPAAGGKGGKPSGPPAGRASDTSKRFEPPRDGKPRGGKPAGGKPSFGKPAGKGGKPQGSAPKRGK